MAMRFGSPGSPSAELLSPLGQKTRSILKNSPSYTSDDANSKKKRSNKLSKFQIFNGTPTKTPKKGTGSTDILSPATPESTKDWNVPSINNTPKTPGSAKGVRFHHETPDKPKRSYLAEMEASDNPGVLCTVNDQPTAERLQGIARQCMKLKSGEKVLMVGFCESANCEGTANVVYNGEIGIYPGEHLAPIPEQPEDKTPFWLPRMFRRVFSDVVDDDDVANLESANSSHIKTAESQSDLHSSVPEDINVRNVQYSMHSISYDAPKEHLQHQPASPAESEDLSDMSDAWDVDTPDTPGTPIAGEEWGSFSDDRRLSDDGQSSEPVSPNQSSAGFDNDPDAYSGFATENTIAEDEATPSPKRGIVRKQRRNSGTFGFGDSGNIVTLSSSKSSSSSIQGFTEPMGEGSEIDSMFDQSLDGSFFDDDIIAEDEEISVAEDPTVKIRKQLGKVKISEIKRISIAYDGFEAKQHGTSSGLPPRRISVYDGFGSFADEKLDSDDEWAEYGSTTTSNTVTGTNGLTEKEHFLVFSSADRSGSPTICGWMHKPNKWVPQGKRRELAKLRWFELHRGVLYYFRQIPHDSVESPCGFIQLTEESNIKHINDCQIDLSTRQQTYTFFTTSIDQANLWHTALQEACNFQMDQEVLRHMRRTTSKSLSDFGRDDDTEC